MKKVYLAILNHGWLRSEVCFWLLNRMRETKDVELYWENPGLTWANPISSNRNLITKRFLNTNCEWLLMIDDDVVPTFNPVELVYADKDIIGFPARVRSSGQTIVWTAYTKHPSGKDYTTIDFTQLDDIAELWECEIVGTGCILIHRRVLEALKAPFSCEFDDDGVQIYGTDFAFCRKAKKAGFHVFTTPTRICEHYKEIGLNDIQGWDDIRGFDSSNFKYKMSWGRWSITQKDWKFIKQIIDEIKPKRILEFGTGLSSLLMSEIVDVISYETDNVQINEIHEKTDGMDNKLFIRKWDGKQLDKDLTFQSTKFDLAFVDGPKGETSGGMGRRNSIRIASEVCNHVIVHDAGREPEIYHQREFLRGKFQMVRNSGDHETRCNYWIRRPQAVTNENFKEVLCGIKENNNGNN